MTNEKGISAVLNRAKKGISGAIIAAVVVLEGLGMAISAQEDPAEKSYQEARHFYQTVLSSTHLREDPRSWEKIIERYENIAISYPTSHRVPYSLYMAARCSARLYDNTHNPDFLGRSIKFFSQLAREHPRHHLADDALYYIGKYSQNLGRFNEAAQAYLQVLEEYPRGDFYAYAQKQYQQLHKEFVKKEKDSQDIQEIPSALPLGSGFQKKWKAAAERFNQKKTIVIDPGHGGKDPGAISSGGLMEKDVVLKIGRLLAQKLTSLPNVKVVMTRTKDRFLSLERRTAIANDHGASMFVSIHLNAHEDPSLSGVETYFLNVTNDPRSLAVAAKENASSNKKLSDLQLILMDLLTDAKIKESSHLAEIVHGELCSHLSRHVNGVRNLGVKQAPFYLLLGAQMPCILLETAYISNPAEERRLKSINYLNLLADGIYRGLLTYQEQLRVAHR